MTRRNSTSNDAFNVLQMCHDKVMEGFVAPHSLSNLYYFLRNEYSDSERREYLDSICRVMTVVPTDNKLISEAIFMTFIPDFEDALQYACAEAVDADYIVTRDLRGYPGTVIPAITPSALLQLVA